MLIFYGKSVYDGIAIGKLRIFEKDTPLVKRTHIDNPKDEVKRFYNAKEQALEELEHLYKKACHEVGEDNAAIFEIHKLMLNDGDYIDSIENIMLNQNLNAEYAVAATGGNFAHIFSEMDDAYMQARAADVQDISERLIRILQGCGSNCNDSTEPSILAAEDLVPSETVQLDKSTVLAFITAKGSANSHTAILARTMNIPAIIGVDLSKADDVDGKLAIVDGFSGTVYIDPDKDILDKMQALSDEENNKRELLQELRGKENVTLCGKHINVFANIGNTKDLALVLQNDAGGIGLFRSEFIYLENNDFPTEEEQFSIYKMVAETMAEKKVIIRTLDIGADKQAKYFNLPQEENPAMGLRAIRLCLKKPEIFKTQLRAIFRAALFGNISIMYPMITSVEEIKRIKEIVENVKNELSEQNIPYEVPEQGIMIETPAAVMISDLLAREVSFFSIGTNDLSQYTLAVDRQNDELDEFYDAHSEAILRMIELTVKNAHEAGIWVGICGELGSDTSLTERFLKMGIDELSVSPSRVLYIRKAIRETRIS